MQKIVLDEIIKAEKDAENIVQQAREKAAEIVAQADSDYNKAIISAREESQKKIQDSVAAAKDKAVLALNKAIEQAEKDNLAFLEKSSERTDAIANIIVDMLLKPEYEQE